MWFNLKLSHYFEFSSQNHNFNQKLFLKSEGIRFWENKDILQIKTFFSNKTNKY